MARIRRTEHPDVVTDQEWLESAVRRLRDPEGWAAELRAKHRGDLMDVTELDTERVRRHRPRSR